MHLSSFYKMILTLNRVISYFSNISYYNLGNSIIFFSIILMSLFFNFNRANFCFLLSILNYFIDYLEEKQCINVIINLIKQATTIFEFVTAFIIGFIKIIQKNRS